MVMRGSRRWFVFGVLLLSTFLTIGPGPVSAGPLPSMAVGSLSYERDASCGDPIIQWQAHDQLNGTWRFTFIEYYPECPGGSIMYRTAPGSPEEGFSGGIDSVWSTPWILEDDDTFTVEAMAYYIINPFVMENITGPAKGILLG